MFPVYVLVILYFCLFIFLLLNIYLCMWKPYDLELVSYKDTCKKYSFTLSLHISVIPTILFNLFFNLVNFPIITNQKIYF